MRRTVRVRMLRDFLEHKRNTIVTLDMGAQEWINQGIAERVVDEPVETAALEPPKRKRGRPRKVVEQPYQ